MLDALTLVVAGLALVVAVVAAVFTGIQAIHTKRQADAAAAALAAADESNDIARKALAEAAAAREIAQREWHGKAEPALTVSLGEGRAQPGGFELIVETNKDLDGCVLELADGTQLTKVTGLSVGLSEALFNYNPAVDLRTVKAGTAAHPAIWLAAPHDGATVQLRCTVKIGADTWGPLVREVKIPAPTRVYNPAKSGRRIGRK